MKNTIKRPLADVLWEAANKWLAADSHDREPPYEFSCAAVTAVFQMPVYKCLSRASAEVDAFLTALGCDCDSWQMFKGVPVGKERQGVRYMWLLLAMHVAEDEGIMVEVAS
jgi:hypothetical protein